jgi:hypothetical protein
MGTMVPQAVKVAQGRFASPEGAGDEPLGGVSVPRSGSPGTTAAFP